MPDFCRFLPVCVSASAAGSSGDGKPFIKLVGSLYPSRTVFNLPRRISRLPLARLKLEPPAGRPGPAGRLGQREKQVLGFLRAKGRPGRLQSVHAGGNESHEWVPARGPDCADRP
jgi:hypothetical protein